MEALLSSQAIAASPREWFAIVTGEGPDRALDVFEVAGWSAAIDAYIARMRDGRHPGGVALRPARPYEVEAHLSAEKQADEPKLAAHWTVPAAVASDPAPEVARPCSALVSGPC